MEKFFGQFDPPVDKFIFERYFPDRDIKGFFVECGACGGLIESSCKFFEESLGWTGINIEPAPPNFRTLLKNRPNSRNLQIGLSDHDGKATFTHAVSPTWGQDFGNGSVQHTPSHLQQLKDSGCSFETFEIEVLTWKALVQREQLTHVDLFVLDVEGHELSVITGMQQCDVLPDVICIEVGHLDFNQIRVELGKLGYSYDISSHVNAFFVKDEKLSMFALRSGAYLSGLIRSSFCISKDTNHAIRVSAGWRRFVAFVRWIRSAIHI